MYTITKIIAGNNYYLNVNGNVWEGLQDNSTKWVNIIDAKRYFDRWDFVDAEIIKL